MCGKYCKYATLFLTIFIALLGSAVYYLLPNASPMPYVDPHAYWGPTGRDKHKADEKLYEFKVPLSEDKISDLKAQLNRSLKYVRPPDGVSHEHGFSGTDLREVARYWRDDYLPRWQERVDYLNQFQQYTTRIQGLNVHFILAKPSPEVALKKTVIPVLVLHGWASTVREFYELIPFLSEGRGSSSLAFEVVVPSSIGCAWSDATYGYSFNIADRAVIMRNLMLRLGYKKFLITSGDWGSFIGDHIATLYPENVIGYHTTLCPLHTRRSAMKGLAASLAPSWFLDNPQKEYSFHFPLWNIYGRLAARAGYFYLQSTRPETIGNALEYNPVGFAGYIFDLYNMLSGAALSDNFTVTANIFTMDALLDNVMIFYLTDSVTTSVRIYADSMKSSYKKLDLKNVPTDVPMGCAHFKYDIPGAFRYQLVDKYPNILKSTYYEEGGHFIALANPKILYEDFQNFVHSVRKFKHSKK